MGCGSTKDAKQTNDPVVTNDEIKRAATRSETVTITSSNFVNQSADNVRKVYKFSKVLGDGAFGKVHVGQHRRTFVKRAIKSIKRKRGQNDDEKEFLNEVEILRKMDHPNIIKIYEYYIEDRHFHLVTDLCKGGELFDYILDQRFLSEQLAAEIMRQLMSAIVYCHSQHIVHRDLKPENLLLESDPGSRGQNIHIKLIDFGTSQLHAPGQKLSLKYGTPYYIAPEVLAKNYDSRCDIWSAGVILYILLSGFPPFNGENETEIYSKIKSVSYNFDNEVWQNVSDQAKDLIRSILVPQDRRPSAEQILQSPWIQQGDQSSKEPISLKAMENLKTFRADRKLQQAVLAFISSQLLTSEDEKELKNTFSQFDKNGDGRLSKQELIDGYAKLVGEEQAEEDTESIMALVDINKDGFVDYSEFIIASMSKKKLLSKQNLNEAFAAFDTDGSGTITVDEIKSILGAVEGDKSDETWNKIISDVDTDKNGKIDLEEFRDMMNKIF